MRIALISDIHANEIALRAVLADIDQIGVDQLVCLGDVATLGPRPNDVIAILRDGKVPCILGNHDEFLLNAQLVLQYTQHRPVIDSIDWCRNQLAGDELTYFETMPRHLEIPLNGSDKLFLYHGSPRSNMEDILATTSPDELDVLLNGRTAVVMAGGHTHIQMLRQHRGLLLVNPGSVGMPFKEYVGGRPPTPLSHAEYAIVEKSNGVINVALRRIPLNKDELRKAIAASNNPLGEELLRLYA
jgi:putative phosphoesterase